MGSIKRPELILFSGKAGRLMVNFMGNLRRACGRLAQPGERGVRNAEVGGSSPLPSTMPER